MKTITSLSLVAAGIIFGVAIGIAISPAINKMVMLHFLDFASSDACVSSLPKNSIVIDMAYSAAGSPFASDVARDNINTLIEDNEESFRYKFPDKDALVAAIAASQAGLSSDDAKAVLGDDRIVLDQKIGRLMRLSEAAYQLRNKQDSKKVSL